MKTACHPAEGAPDFRDAGWQSMRAPALHLLLAFLAVLTACGLFGLDRLVADAVRAHEPDWMRALAVAVSRVGAVGLYPLAAAVLLVWSWRVRPDRWLGRVCLWILAAEGVCALVVRVLKIGFGRWRPERTHAGEFVFFTMYSRCHSFPSGHTADIVAVATVLWLVCPRLRPICLVAALVMAAARIGAAQHFLADAAAGSAIGIVCALAAGRVLPFLERRVGGRWAANRP